MSRFMPMKGDRISPEEFHLLQFPLYLSVKLDGIRCLVKDGKALTAALKPLPNAYVRNFLESDRCFEGFDGELLLRNSKEFNDVSSAFMSRDGEPDFVYWVFDRHDLGGNDFETRLCYMRNDPLPGADPRVRLLPHIKCNNLDHLNGFLEAVLNAGHEGVMLRRPDLPYKFGKASIKQGHLLKVKPMAEMEAIIYGFEEGEENQNEATLNERGLTTRSSCKEGKIPNGTLGKLLVRNKRFGDFKIGTGIGLTKEFRAAIWSNPETYRGGIIRFKYQEIGTVDKPRLPIYLGFRSEDDLEPELVRELRSLLSEAP